MADQYQKRGLLARAEQAGRNGDTEMGHLTRGEVVVPRNMQTGAVMQAIGQAAAQSGVDPNRYIVGDRAGPRNPVTGREEFYGDGTAGDSSYGGDAAGPGPGTGGSGGMSGVGSANAANGTANAGNTAGANAAYGGDVGAPGAGGGITGTESTNAAIGIANPTTEGRDNAYGPGFGDKSIGDSVLGWLDALYGYVEGKLSAPTSKNPGVLGTAVGFAAPGLGGFMGVAPGIAATVGEAVTSGLEGALGPNTGFGPMGGFNHGAGAQGTSGAGTGDNAGEAGQSGEGSGTYSYSVADDEPLPYVLPRRGLLINRGRL